MSHIFWSSKRLKQDFPLSSILLAIPRLVKIWWFTQGFRAWHGPASYPGTGPGFVRLLWQSLGLLYCGYSHINSPGKYDLERIACVGFAKITFIQWTRCVMWGFSNSWALSWWRRVHNITAGRHNQRLLRHEHCKTQVVSLSQVLSL